MCANKDNLPSVGVGIGLSKRLLGHAHLGILGEAEEVLCHAKNVIVVKRERRIDQIGEADCRKDLVQPRR